MGIKTWRDAISEKLGRLDITSMAQSQAVEELQQMVAKADLADKIDVETPRNDSSEWTAQMRRNPGLSEIGAMREGLSSSGKGASEATKRFSDLSEHDKTTELYAELGEMLKSAATMAKMLERMNDKELKKSSHLRDIVRNLAKAMRQVAKALGCDDADDDDDEESNDDDRPGSDMNKAKRVRQYAKAQGIPEFQLKEVFDIVSGRKTVINTPPDFMAKSMRDEITDAQAILDSGELTLEQSMRLQTAIARVQAARSGTRVPHESLNAAIMVIQQPFNSGDINMTGGGNV
jgi:hypothetical protein